MHRAVSGGRAGVAGGGEQVEERADPVSFLGRVPEQAVRVQVYGYAAGSSFRHRPACILVLRYGTDTEETGADLHSHHAGGDAVMVGSMDSRAAELCAQAAAARRQAQALTERLHAAQREAAETLQRIHAARERAEQIRQLWLAAGPSRLRYSRYARLQAQLASMPVIEQAKGIIMAQSGWPEEQAFDALRQASQRENIKVRDLAARVVASAVSPAAGSPAAGSPAAGSPAAGSPAAGPRRVRPPHPATAPGNDARQAKTG